MLSKEDKKILDEEFIERFEISPNDAKIIHENAVAKKLKKGALIYTKDENCGYIIVKGGVLRAFITSQNLKEITIFKLKGGDNCVICSSCTMSSFDTEITISIEEDVEAILIPIHIFKNIKDNYNSVLNHALSLLSARFASAITAMEQALFAPLVSRVKNFLVQNAKDGEVSITHEQLANHLGSAREAVSRILKEMEKSGAISQKRGKIYLLDKF